MDNIHDKAIYTIVGIIICAQLFFFLKNFKKIMSYKNIIVGNDKLSLIELSVDEDEVTTQDPEYFINNESSFKVTSPTSFENNENIDDLSELSWENDEYDESDEYNSK